MHDGLSARDLSSREDASTRSRKSLDRGCMTPVLVADPGIFAETLKCLEAGNHCSPVSFVLPELHQSPLAIKDLPSKLGSSCSEELVQLLRKQHSELAGSVQRMANGMERMEKMLQIMMGLERRGRRVVAQPLRTAGSQGDVYEARSYSPHSPVKHVVPASRIEMPHSPHKIAVKTNGHGPERSPYGGSEGPGSRSFVDKMLHGQRRPSLCSAAGIQSFQSAATAGSTLQMRRPSLSSAGTVASSVTKDTQMPSALSSTNGEKSPVYSTSEREREAGFLATILHRRPPSPSCASELSKPDPRQKKNRSSLLRAMSTLPTDLEEVDRQRRKQVRETGQRMSRFSEETALPEDDEASFCPFCWQQLREVESSMTFEIFFAFMILANSVSIGVEVDYLSQYSGGEALTAFAYMNYFFAGIFALELVIRLLAHGRRFFGGPNWTWNMLDIFIVASSAAEIAMEIVVTNSPTASANMSNIRIIRMVRITRLIRVLRVARVIRFIRALRTLVSSILYTLKSLVWAILLLLMIIYIFGIMFTQAVIQDLPADGSLDDAACGSESLQLYWGSLSKSMYTLFKSFTSGVSWEEATKPLEGVNIVLVILFIGFISFTLLAVLNVVTGVFVHSAIESATKDQDMLVQSAIATKRAYVDQMRRLFANLNGGASEFLTFDVFEKHMEDDEMVACFSSMDLDVDDAWVLFKLMDSDNTHSVGAEEFIGGCLRLKGPAKSIQVAQLLCENKWLSAQLRRFMVYVEQQFLGLSDALVQRSEKPIGAYSTTDCH